MYISPEAQNEFFQNIGVCITSWAKIEFTLFGLLRLSLGTNEQLSSIVYYRTPSLESRISLVYEIVSAVIPKPVRKNGGHNHPLLIELGKILPDIRELMPVRNAIAHNGVMVSVFQNSKSPRIEAPLHVSPSITESWRGKNLGVSDISIGDLAKHQKSVTKAWQRLSEFSEKLEKLLQEQRGQ